VVLHIHQRCYVRRRKRVEDDRAKVAEEEARLNELRARSRAGTHIGEDASGVAKDNGRQENPDTPDKEEEAEAIHALRPKRYLKTYEIFFMRLSWA
jgi:hypothetical protein